MTSQRTLPAPAGGALAASSGARGCPSARRLLPGSPRRRMTSGELSGVNDTVISEGQCGQEPRELRPKGREAGYPGPTLFCGVRGSLGRLGNTSGICFAAGTAWAHGKGRDAPKPKHPLWVPLFRPSPPTFVGRAQVQPMSTASSLACIPGLCPLAGPDLRISGNVRRSRSDRCPFTPGRGLSLTNGDGKGADVTGEDRSCCPAGPILGGQLRRGRSPTPTAAPSVRHLTP